MTQEYGGSKSMLRCCKGQLLSIRDLETAAASACMEYLLRRQEEARQSGGGAVWRVGCSRCRRLAPTSEKAGELCRSRAERTRAYRSHASKSRVVGLLGGMPMRLSTHGTQAPPRRAVQQLFYGEHDAGHAGEPLEKPLRAPTSLRLGRGGDT